MRFSVANFYILKRKKIAAGRVALGDWLGRYRLSTCWAFLPNLGSGSWTVRTRGFWQWLQRGFSGGDNGKELTCQCRRHKRCRFDPREDPLEGHKESDRTEQLNAHPHTKGLSSGGDLGSGLRFCGLRAGLHTGHSPACSFTCPSGWPPPPLPQPCISSMGPLSQLLSRLKRSSRLDSYVLIL